MKDLAAQPPAGSEECTQRHVCCGPEIFRHSCPNRELFDQIADKWSMMILSVLAQEPTRFNGIKRRLEGISQKSLTQTLRKLERNGLVVRTVRQTSPVAVEYSLSPLGETLLPPFRALYMWTREHFDTVREAQQAYDVRVSAS